MSIPKIHFDIEALLTVALGADIGIRITTNHPEGFLRIVYAHMRAVPDLRCFIYRDKRTRNSFFLLKTPQPNAKESHDV